MSKQTKKNNYTLIQQEQERVERIKSDFELEIINGHVCLTQDNAVKIETLILLNPQYGNVVDKTSKDSAMFYINELKTGSAIYDKKSIETIIKCINSENSTRMSKDEMDILSQKIVQHARTKDELINKLKDKNYPLIDIIAASINTKTKKGDERNRSNFSFATKFCHYMCFYLFEGEMWQDYYSIYDNIVIEALPDYTKNNKTKKLKPFNKSKGKEPSEYYKEFQDLIGKILKENGNNISRNAFDHIMWYYTKSNKKTKKNKETKKAEESAKSNNNQTNEQCSIELQ